MNGTELVVVEKLNLPALFESGGSNPLLKNIKEEVMKFVPDLSTATGRKDIASLAHKIARSKTLLDGLGKDLVAEIKAKAGIIDSERKKIRDELDQLKEDVRRPLTKWEAEEEERITNIKYRISSMLDHLDMGFEDSEEISNVLKEVKAIIIDDSFKEFANEAAQVKDRVITQLEAKLIVRTNQEKEQVEKERLEKERAEKERKEREEKIAKEAAEAATKQAEDKAKIEAEEKDRIAEEAIEKERREKLEAQFAVEKAEKEKKEAAERAEIDKRLAVEAENERIRQEQYEKEQEATKREANKKHRDKIVGEIRADMKSFKSQYAVIDAIIDGKIRHIKVQF